MKFTTALSALCLATSAVARPLEERQNGLVYLTQKSSVQNRLEIRTLKDTQPNQYNLLIVALNRWQQTGQTLNTGYFQLAAIHGVPRANYNNVGQCSACGGTDGYAVHDSILFPSWHRAYVALWEQEFLKVVQQVASEYPASQRSTMQAAAAKMRYPYYDAAAIPKSGMSNFPLILSEYKVTVNGPSGSVTMVNPLFTFNIGNPSGFVYADFTTWDHTLRYPNTNAANAVSEEQGAINTFQNIRQNLADSMYSLFSNCHDWYYFSNDRAGSSIPSCSGSLEDVHNTIHTAIGGPGGNGVEGGHMTYLPVSSFDPTFMLHHANIDRWAAFWQTLNPSSWDATQNQPTASWTIPVNQPVTEDSALTPFLRTSGGNGGFWTPNGLRNWQNLGYSYPEYTGSRGNNQAAISQAINRLYGPNAGVGVQKRDLVDSLAATASSLTNPLVAANNSVYQYVANIYTPRYLLDGSYQIYLFNTPPASETDTTTWLTDSNLIGFVGILSKPGMTDNDLMGSSSIPLTRTLQQMTSKLDSTGSPLLADLTEALVVPYLTKNLQWRIAGPTGQPLDPSTVPGFVLSVFASTASQPASDTELPVWSNWVDLIDVTKNQAGGANSTEQATIPPQSDASLVSAAQNLVSSVIN